ncbi:hypothetical protein B0H11DRAFT_2131261 [Mycena galericulata]|nr:hypothetical protein B0H11DRAFT_2131261 [Mycena galericulata]
MYELAVSFLWLAVVSLWPVALPLALGNLSLATSGTSFEATASLARLRGLRRVAVHTTFTSCGAAWSSHVARWARAR